jgi:hypothetical protein
VLLVHRVKLVLPVLKVNKVLLDNKVLPDHKVPLDLVEILGFSMRDLQYSVLLLELTL